MELAERLVKEYNEGFHAGYGSLSRELAQQPAPEPTKLTRDQAIRAKALELAAEKTSDVIIGTDDFFKLAVKFEDYIRDGRKGDE